MVWAVVYVVTFAQMRRLTKGGSTSKGGFHRTPISVNDSTLPSACYTVAIPDDQKLQALAVTKIKISIHQKKALSELCRTITVGRWELR